MRIFWSGFACIFPTQTWPILDDRSLSLSAATDPLPSHSLSVAPPVTSYAETRTIALNNNESQTVTVDKPALSSSNSFEQAANSTRLNSNNQNSGNTDGADSGIGSDSPKNSKVKISPLDSKYV